MFKNSHMLRLYITAKMGSSFNQDHYVRFTCNTFFTTSQEELDIHKELYLGISSNNDTPWISYILHILWIPRQIIMQPTCTFKITTYFLQWYMSMFVPVLCIPTEESTGSLIPTIIMLMTAILLQMWWYFSAGCRRKSPGILTEVHVFVGD